MKSPFTGARWNLILCGALFVSGCSEPEVVQSEPKRADDAITQAELESFLAIVDSLAEPRFSAMPSVLLPAPQWSRNRSLPVNELVKEEETASFERGSIDWLSVHCPQSRFLKRALRREKMTIEQFVGLYLALGASLSRDKVPADRNIEQILIRGKQAVVELKKDRRIYSSLSQDESYFLQVKSGWLAVVDRAERLKNVHPANLALVRQHHDRLAALMPGEFLENPFREFVTILDDRGIPFHEPLGQESDDRISWSRDQALVGSDGGDKRDTPR